MAHSNIKWFNGKSLGLKVKIIACSYHNLAAYYKIITIFVFVFSFVKYDWVLNDLCILFWSPI